MPTSNLFYRVPSLTAGPSRGTKFLHPFLNYGTQITDYPVARLKLPVATGQSNPLNHSPIQGKLAQHQWLTRTKIEG
jgi:hypothetical protein